MQRVHFQVRVGVFNCQQILAKISFVMMMNYTRFIDLSGPTRTRRNHDFKIRPSAARTIYFKFSFFNRYVNDWNSLPNSVRSASSLNVFKNRLLNYLCTQWLEIVNAIVNLFVIVIVIIFQLGEQFLYGNSVSPYCFPLPSVPIYIYIFSLYYLHICTVV